MAHKIIYVAAAPPREAAADLRRLGLLAQPDSLRVLVPAALAPELESRVPLPRSVVWRYELIRAPWLWLRLMRFLGSDRAAEIIACSSHRQSRLLKLFAFSLRGRVTFSYGSGASVSFSLARLLWAELGRIAEGQGPFCLIGSASPASVEAILSRLRARYPDAWVHGVLPASSAGSVQGLNSLDVVHRPGLAAYARLLRRCVGRGRIRRMVLPWTDEQFSALRWLAWLLPLWRVEIYNENLDAFSGRNFPRLLSHWFWRRALREKQRRGSLPVGVIGSASSFYLDKILPVVREQCPGVPVHGLLPESLAGPAAKLFDSVEVLRGNVFARWIQARRFVRARKDWQCWIVPCTNEPYAGMKFLALLLPLARRRIYNELADGFGARDLGTLYGHCLWRLRDHLSFQIVAGAVGRNRLARAGRLVSYAVRLLAGALLLARTLLGPRFLPRRSRPAPRVDLLVLSAAEDGPAALEPVSSSASVRVVRVVRSGSLEEVNAAIQASNAEFVGLLDGECRVSPSDWIERLLESFDDRTAQVGPQLASPDGATFLRGLLLESRGALAWNLDNAVQWRRRPECLEVDALPWPCVLIRRKIFSEVGYFAEDSGTMEEWADARFSGRLAARGWRSVCNRSVTATHPAAELRLRTALRETTEELRR